MGTPSSRPRSGCCGLSSALQSSAVQAGKAALQRERGGRRRAEIAILLTGGPALWWWTNPQLRSVCIAAGWPGVPNYGNVVAQS